MLQSAKINEMFAAALDFGSSADPERENYEITLVKDPSNLKKELYRAKEFLLRDPEAPSGMISFIRSSDGTLSVGCRTIYRIPEGQGSGVIVSDALDYSINPEPRSSILSLKDLFPFKIGVSTPEKLPETLDSAIDFLSSNAVLGGVERGVIYFKRRANDANGVLVGYATNLPSDVYDNVMEK